MSNAAHFRVRESRAPRPQIPRWMPFICLFFTLLNSELTVVRAQGIKASITGLVTDNTGGVLPGATVTARNQETNAQRSQISGDVGLYLIRNLAPGVYTVTASLPGFMTYEHTELLLQVDQDARLDIKLAVGEVTERVTVTGQSPLLETQTQERGEVIVERQIVDLPLNGRDYLQLAHLTVGVVSGKTNYGEPLPNINGTRVFDVGYTLDGGDNTDFYHLQPATRPSVDSIKEFKIMTTGFGAQYGRAMGGLINAVMKTGTNEFHGSLFEFVRNDKFDAVHFFANKAGLGKPPFRQNQFGATLGGPIVSDRSFFFFAFDGTRIRNQRIRSAIVPDAAQKAGDFSGSAIYDPFNHDATGQRIAFAGGRIPSSRVHPIAQKILSYWPDPNQADLPNFTRTLSANNDENQFIGRFDHSLTDQDDFFARFSYQNRPRFEPGTLPGFGSDLTRKSFHAMLSWTRTFSPTIINEINVSGLHNSPKTVPEHAEQVFNLGFPNEATLDLEQQGFPSIGVTGFAGFGGTRRGDPSTVYTATDNFSIHRGNHLFKFGFQWFDWGINDLLASTGGVGTNFDGGFTGPLDDARTGLASRGESFADFLLGTPQQVNNGLPLGIFRGRQSQYHLYAADDWQVSSRLTMNLGLRWEINLPHTVAHNRAMANPDYVNQQVIYPRGAPLETGPGSIPGFAAKVPHSFRPNERLYDPNYKYLAPRIGVAFRANDRTVFRLGGGIYYGQATGSVGRSVGWAPPWFARTREFYNTAATPTTFMGYVPTINVDTLLANGLDFKAVVADMQPSATSYQWSLNLQRELSRDLALDVGYVGIRAVDLWVARNLNRPDPGPGDVQSRRPLKIATSCECWLSDSTSKYHSLQVKLQRRFSEGLFFLAGYTLSKSQDRVGIWVSNPQNIRDIDADHALTDHDVRNRFTFNTVWELPFAKGMSGGARHVLDGWQLGTIVTLQTGFPYTPFVSNRNFYVNTGGRSHLRPDLRGENWGNLPESQRTVDRFFNPGAFGISERYTWGDAGRNILIQDGLANVDFSVIRNLSFAESHRIQLRFEFFNFFNHANFAAPSANVDRGDVGRVRNAAAARQVQFGIKYAF